MAVTQKVSIPIDIKGTATSATRCEVVARDHRFIIDEPFANHGTNEGPTPLQTLLGAFAGCTTVILNRIAMEQKITISALSIGVTGHLDRRGIAGTAVVTNVFPDINLTIDCTMAGAPDDLGPLQQALRERCPVSVLLRQAGSNVHETWNVVRV